MLLVPPNTGNSAADGIAFCSVMLFGVCLTDIESMVLIGAGLFSMAAAGVSIYMNLRRRR